MIRRMCPSDQRFVTGFLSQPDENRVVGAIDRDFQVNAKDIKVILQDLTNSPSVLQILMQQFKNRFDKLEFYYIFINLLI